MISADLGTGLRARLLAVRCWAPVSSSRSLLFGALATLASTPFYRRVRLFVSVPHERLLAYGLLKSWN